MTVGGQGRLQQTSDGLRFRSPAQPLVLGIFVGFVLIFCVGGLVNVLTHPHRKDAVAEAIALSVATLVVAWLVVRIVRSGTLIASRQGVVVRTILRTHQWRWPDVASFEEVIRPIGATQVPRRVLRAHLVASGVRDLTELNESSKRDPDLIAELVDRLTAFKESASDRASG